jgi:hypothetical protein
LSAVLKRPLLCLCLKGVEGSIRSTLGGANPVRVSLLDPQGVDEQEANNQPDSLGVVPLEEPDHLNTTTSTSSR